MSAPEGTQLSKSARKRQNKKAREAAGAEEDAEEEPKVAAGKENTTSNPKAAAKAAAAIPSEKTAQPKAKGKAAAAPKAEPKAAAPAEVPKAKPASKPAAKPASKAAAKAKGKPVVEEEEEPVKKEELINWTMDDGKGGDWEEASGMSKKMQRSKERQQAKKEQEKLMKSAAAKAPGGTQYIPGMAPVIEVKAKAKAGAPVASNASVSAAAAATKAEEPKADTVTLHTATVKVPDDKVALVIGPKGKVINAIKEKTGIKTFDMDGDRATFSGGAKEVAMAEVAIQEIVTKGYCSLLFDNFSEAVVPCYKIDMANIIGKGGEIIQKIKEHCKVEINMPKSDDKDPKSNPYKRMKISIAGDTDGVETCKDVLNGILTYGHHEVTHPGLVHEELEVAEWQYAFIIGSKGCEMRHIQNNYKVKVNIPREKSTLQTVLVVGEPRDVQRASAYIWKLLEAGSQPRGRGAPDKAEDTWGDEEPEEEWMSQYMYKRS